MKNLEDYLKQNLHESSVKSYLYHIEKYKKINKNASKFNYQKVMQYIELLRKTYQIGTIKTILASIKKYYEYLIETGERKDNPAKSIKLRDKPQNTIQLQDLLTEKDLENLLKPKKTLVKFIAKPRKSMDNHAKACKIMQTMRS